MVAGIEVDDVTFIVVVMRACGRPPDVVAWELLVMVVLAVCLTAVVGRKAVLKRDVKDVLVSVLVCFKT